MKRRLLPLALVALLPACSYLRSNTKRCVSTGTNGVVTVTETTSARGWTLLDANASLVKFYNRSGYATNSSGTFAPGTYAAGVNESSSSTGLVSVISAVAQGVAAGLRP